MNGAVDGFCRFLVGWDYYRKPFEFLSLGIMAYVGNDKALTQVGSLEVVQLFTSWYTDWHNSLVWPRLLPRAFAAKRYGR